MRCCAAPGGVGSRGRGPGHAVGKLPMPQSGQCFLIFLCLIVFTISRPGPGGACRGGACRGRTWGGSWLLARAATAGRRALGKGSTNLNCCGWVHRVLGQHDILPPRARSWGPHQGPQAHINRHSMHHCPAGRNWGELLACPQRPTLPPNLYNLKLISIAINKTIK